MRRTATKPPSLASLNSSIAPLTNSRAPPPSLAESTTESIATSSSSQLTPLAGHSRFTHFPAYPSASFTFAIYILRQVQATFQSPATPQRILELASRELPQPSSSSSGRDQDAISQAPDSSTTSDQPPIAELVASSTFCTITSLPQSTDAVAKYHRRFHFDDPQHPMMIPTPGELEISDYFSVKSEDIAEQQQQQQQPHVAKFHPNIFIIVDRADWETEGVLAVKLGQVTFPLRKGNAGAIESVRVGVQGLASRLRAVDEGWARWEEIGGEAEEKIFRG